MGSESEVLLLSPFFFPELISTGKYNTCLAEALVLRGVRVSVVSSHPLFPAWKVMPSRDKMAGVSIFRGGEFVRYPASTFLRRAVLETWFAWHVVTTCLSRRIKSEVVVPIFPPSLFFCVLSAFISHRVRKVGVVHDLQGVYAGQEKGLLAKWVGAAIHAVEKRCFQSCDRLIFLSMSMQNRALSEYGLSPKKCVVCYPFVVLPEFCSVGGGNLRHLFPPEKTHIVYSGALGNKQKPDGLYTFMVALMKSDKDVQCHIFSGGPHFERLKSLHGSDGTVDFHDLVSGEDLDELYLRSDIQLIPQELGTGDGSLPSKLPNLMAAGVPVFVICDEGSEVGLLVQNANAGAVVHTWNPQELVDTFGKFKQALAAETRAVRKGRLQQYVIDKFNIEHVVREILRS
ncbi:glycosyltransferase family 4 protein [Uliginosibacterium gangwonense]|uniref:glycosyltransferase family 4 protein n=1 Tax=Uliginosibacterium gangwonense TaxID=392736 RepID=UPI000375098E|nr:glycosyltransferase family 4 protein [Uliginosibacterium gangwonense]